MKLRNTKIIPPELIQMSKEKRMAFLKHRQGSLIQYFNDFSKTLGTSPIKTNKEFIEQCHSLAKKNDFDQKNRTTPEQKCLGFLYDYLKETKETLDKNKLYLKRVNLLKKQAKASTKEIAQPKQSKEKETNPKPIYGPLNDLEYLSKTMEEFGQLMDIFDFMEENQIPPKILPKDRNPN